MHPRRFVGVLFGMEFLDNAARIGKFLQVSKFINFDNCEAVAAEYSPSYDATILYLHHQALPAVPEGCECLKYWYRDARRKFPYLFADTNPILYRKFN